MNKINTLKALSGLQLAFKKDFAEDQLEFYVKMLADIEPDILSKAVKKIIMTAKFLPTIAEIRQTAMELENKVNNHRQKDVDEAWAEVQRQLQESFLYKAPVFSSQEIADAVAGMGWTSLCNMLSSESGTFRAQFRDMYKTACMRHKNNDIDRKIGVYELPQIKNNVSQIGEMLKNLKGIQNE